MSIPPNSPFAAPQPYHPRCAGHRGFKALYPENTILAMRKAIEAGATIIETDIQVAGDGIIVISHDPNAMRCFGVDHEITTTPYKGVLDSLQAIDTPTSAALGVPQHMPTFEEVCELFVSDPQFAGIQLMLDIKRTNEPWVIPKIVESLHRVNPDLEGFWAKRMVLGVWRWDVLVAANESCPELPVLHIGLSRSLARKFMAQSQVIGVSLNEISLNIVGGSAFIREAQNKGKLVYSWTVNSTSAMKWAISANLDGIITDSPDKYCELLHSIDEHEIETVYAAKQPSSFFTWKETISYQLKYVLLYFWSTYMELTTLLGPVRKSPS